MFIAVSFVYSCQDMEAAQVPISSRWGDKTTVGHLHNRKYLAVEKKKILPFATIWVGLENMMPGEISQSEKDKYHMVSLICGLLMNKLN